MDDIAAWFLWLYKTTGIKLTIFYDPYDRNRFITGFFTCPEFKLLPGAPGNFAHFCDRNIDEMALSAGDLQVTDPALANQRWAEVDHEIVDQSPAVAAFNPIQLAFVSKRVGNVQVHPVLRVLISQMWVQ